MSSTCNQWTWADERHFMTCEVKDIHAYQARTHRLRGRDFNGRPITDEWRRKFDAACRLARNARARDRSNHG